MKRILSSILVFAMLFTFVPTAFAGTTTDYTVDLGDASYTVEPGATVEIPVYVKNNNGTGTDLAMFQVEVVPPAGFTATAVGSTNVKTSDITIHPTTQTVGYANDSGISFTNTEAIITITLTAPATAGSYDIKFGANTYLIDADLNPIESVATAGATITVAEASAPDKQLTGIDVKPDTLTVPYANQGAGIQAFVEDAITSVTATYLDGTTAPATGYTVAVSGNVATVTYEGVADTIALTLESAPTPPPAASTDYTVDLGAATYTVEAGATVEIPVYVKNNNGTGTDLAMFQVEVVPPAGFTATAVGSTNVKTSDITIHPTTQTVGYANDSGISFTNTEAIITITLTAPATAGSYDIKFGANTYLIDADLNPIESVATDGATITVTGGGSVEPPAPTLTGITVAPTAIEIPYGTENDAKYVGENITITANYSDNTTAPVTEGFNVEVSGGVATITYNGVSATVAVTYEAAPAPTVQSISVSPETLDVPYATADVIEYVKSKITVTAAMSDGTAQPVSNYSIQITGNEALITYEGLTDTVALTQTVVTDVTSSVEQIVVPYGTEDVDAYIRANVGTITVHFSDNTTKVLEPGEYTVEIDPGSSAAVYFGTTGRYVKIPVTVVTLDCVMVYMADEANVDRKIVLPYDIEDADVEAFIKNNIIVYAFFSNAQEPVTVPAADYSVVEFVLSGEPVENSYTVEYEGVASADNFFVVRGAAPVEITGINVVQEELVIPYGTEDIVAYIKANINVKTLESDGGSNPVTAFEVALDGNVATVTYEGFNDTLTIIGESVEKIYADKSAIEIPYTVASDAVNAYILENVKVYYKYSHNTADALVAAEDIQIAIEASSGVATLTVGIFNTTINVTFEPIPEYIVKEVVNETTGKVYAIDNAKLLVFTDVMAGKAIFVNGVAASYVGNNTYAYVVVGDYQITTADMTAAPVAVEFGKLHDQNMVTAFDALLALNKGLGKDVEVFDNNIQNYILADIDGDGVIDATDAQMINNISLGKTVRTWVDSPASGGNSSGGGASSRPGATPVIPELN